MKSKFILATSVAMALAASAQAETIVITGATALRAVMNRAIANAYGSAKVAYSSEGATSLDKAQYAVFDDRANSGDLILTSFTGSVEGIKALDQNELVNIIDVTAFTNTGTVGTPLVLTTPAKVSAAPDAAFSDVYQASTDYQSKGLQDTLVGVVPFVWAINKAGKDLGITNITTQLATVVLQNDGTVASLFTGNNAHSSNPVYAVGRDKFSGTRMTTLAEIKYPAATDIYQYELKSATQLTPWASDLGYNSGSKVITALNTITSGALANTVLIGYSSVSDASMTNGATLSYNGVPYSVSNVQNGLYTFWGYEHLFTPEAGLSTEKQAVVDLIVSKIPLPAVMGTSAITVDSMSVMRLSDGAFIFAL